MLLFRGRVRIPTYAIGGTCAGAPRERFLPVSGGSRIRTCVGIRRQVYSLVPLAARASPQRQGRSSVEGPLAQTGMGCSVAWPPRPQEDLMRRFVPGAACLALLALVVSPLA